MWTRLVYYLVLRCTLYVAVCACACLHVNMCVSLSLCVCVRFSVPTSLALPICSIIRLFDRISFSFSLLPLPLRYTCDGAFVRLCMCNRVVYGIRGLHLDNNVQYGRAHNALHMQPNIQASSSSLLLLLSSLTSRTQCNCLIFSLHPRQIYTRPYQLLLLLLLLPPLMLH